MTLKPFNPGLSKNTVFKYLTLILGVIYLLNCFSALRFHVDTVRYFAIKDCFEIGCAPDSFAAQDYLPYGYTFLLLGLSKLGILKSFTVVLFNCLFLFGGLYFLKKLYTKTSPYVVFTFILLNWTTIKFVVHPLSEMQYIFFSMASLYYFHLFTENRKLLPLFGSLLLATAAFLTRSVGVTLFAALIAGLIWTYRDALKQLFLKNKILIVLAFALLAGTFVFSKELGMNHYLDVLAKQFAEGRAYGTIIQWHFTEFSEIFLNLSIARVNAFGYAALASVAFLLIGIALLAGIIWLFFIRKTITPFIVKAYVLFYCLLMFNWPFYDPRFWVPVLPIFLMELSTLNLTKKIYRQLALIPLSFYALVGIGSIGYMTYTSFDNEYMAKKQANGVYRNEYEQFFYGKPLSDTATYVDPYLLETLKRHN